MRFQETTPLESLQRHKDSTFNTAIENIARDLIYCGVTFEKNKLTLVSDDHIYYHLYRGEVEHYNE